MLLMALDQAEYSPEVWAEIEKLRELGIEDDDIEQLMESAKQTVEIMEAAEKLEDRLAELDRVLAARPDFAACERAAAERLGAPVEGTLTLSLHDGVGITATELAREGNVDDGLASCVIGLVDGLALKPDPDHPSEGKTLPLSFGRPAP